VRLRLYRTFGFLFLAVGTVGVFLPLLPTTPFVLLSAACFARSSEKWHRWLLANGTFGPMIRDWESKRCVSRRVKAVAIGSMLGVGGYSVLFVVEMFWLKLAGSVLVLAGLVSVLMLRTCKDKAG
jgi:hypothetical protein